MPLDAGDELSRAAECGGCRWLCLGSLLTAPLGLCTCELFQGPRRRRGSDPVLSCLSPRRTPHREKGHDTGSEGPGASRAGDRMLQETLWSCKPILFAKLVMAAALCKLERTLAKAPFTSTFQRQPVYVPTRVGFAFLAGKRVLSVISRPH